jgi:ATP-dependent DNA helicase DinG
LRITWIDVRDRSVSIGASPIDLGPTLRQRLFERVSTVIATSATLATAVGARPPSFHFARARLGAPAGTAELVVPSPFDYRARAALYVPQDLPEPSDPSFERLAVERIVQLVNITQGGAFVLCTSTRAMRAIHGALKGRIPYALFVQGEAPKHLLLSRFRASGSAVLVATMSFWEGVDVPGHALRLVILDKIPFAVPTDPVLQARCAEIERQGGNPFAQLSVPSAAIALKQGFGRLLRTQRDGGIVALLDRRMISKGYGKTLLSSLPPARRVSSVEGLAAFWAEVAPSLMPENKTVTAPR